MILEKNFVTSSLVAVNFEKKEVPVTMKVTDSVKLALDGICADNDRPLSYVARELMLRGLALYRQDGRLKDEAAAHRAPVVATIGSEKAEVRRQFQQGMA